MKNQETKNYFIDTEFHEHKKPVKFLGITISKVWTIDLISIGIVCEDGRSYYAMNRDLNLKQSKKNKWLKENVLDKLPAKQKLYPPHGSPRLWQENMRWLPMEQIRQEVIDFCGGKPDNDVNVPFYEYSNGIPIFYEYSNGTPIFYGYYADYDWVVFCWLFGTMMNLPNGFPMFCKDLKQMLDDKLIDFQISLGEVTGGEPTEKDREATFEEKLKWLKTQPNYPTQKNEHNALDDANWNFKLFQFIKERWQKNNPHQEQVVQEVMEHHKTVSPQPEPKPTPPHSQLIKEGRDPINVESDPLFSYEFDGKGKTCIRWDRTRTINYNGSELQMNIYSCSTCKTNYKFEEIIHKFCPFCGEKYKFKTDVSI